MKPTIPEKNKRPGVCYALTDNGLELPVIDITHPIFEIRLTEGKEKKLLERFLRDINGPENMPAFLRPLVFSFMRKRSVIMRGLMGATDTFMSGMNTYLMKLGPDNLNKSYFNAIDRRIVASGAASFMRIRLQDIAYLLADAIIVPLETQKGATLRLLNIGGGPAIDSLNALIIVHKRQPELLNGRHIFVYSLDQDAAGPNFGVRALASLLADGAPLHGLQISFEHIRYNWSHSQDLLTLIESFKDQTNLVAASSEGSLFEYGIDEDIVTNLQALGKFMSANTVIAGSVTRADELGRRLNGTRLGSQAALQFRGLEAFKGLAFNTGWKVIKVIDRPLCHDVLLEKN